jgi:ATP/ADP translocase
MDSSLTIIGFLFTLISLLGSFFYIQISNWYSEVLELNKKYEENKEKTNAEMKDAIRECRYEYKKWGCSR